MTDDETTRDPVDVAEQFAAESDAETAVDGPESSAERLADLGRWLVAEARWQAESARLDCLSIAKALTGSSKLSEAYARVNTELALKLREQAAVHRSGATPDYVHDPRTTITEPGDFLAWLLDLSGPDRLAVAADVLRHADEARRCHEEKHREQLDALTAMSTRGGVPPSTPSMVMSRLPDAACGASSAHAGHRWVDETRAVLWCPGAGTHYATWTTDELRGELQRRAVSTLGERAVLIRRLIEDDVEYEREERL